MIEFLVRNHAYINMGLSVILFMHATYLVWLTLRIKRTAKRVAENEKNLRELLNRWQGITDNAHR